MGVEHALTHTAHTHAASTHDARTRHAGDDDHARVRLAPRCVYRGTGMVWPWRGGYPLVGEGA